MTVVPEARSAGWVGRRSRAFDEGLTATDAARHLVADLDARRLALRLLVLVAVVAALVLATATGTGISAFDVREPWSLPAALTAALLVIAAGLVIALGRRQGAARPSRPGPEAAGAVSGLVLVVLAADVVAQLHERLEDAASGLRLLVALHALLAVALALALALAPISGRRRAVTLATGGLVLLLAGLTVAAARVNGSTGWDGSAAMQALLELPGAALLALGLLAAAQARLRTDTARPTVTGTTSTRALDFVAALPLRRVAAVLALGIAVFGLLGAFQAFVAPVAVLDLDSEFTLPAYFSGYLLLLAAVAAWARAQAGEQRALVWLLLAGFFVFMSADEVIGLHEQLASAAGLYWQVLYLPLILAGGTAWLLTLRELRGQPLAAGLFILGAVAFVVAQACDTLQWSGNTEAPSYRWTTVPEEILEMTGSALFGLAILLSIQHVLRRRRVRGTEAPGPVGASVAAGRT